MTSTRRSMRRWTLKDGSRLNVIPAWKKILSMPIDTRVEQLRQPDVRRDLDRETTQGEPIEFSRRWDLISVKKVVREENKACEGMSIAELANEQHKSPIDAMLDLALAENLETTFEDSTTQGDEQAVKEIFCNPNVLLGQSDAGAHMANGNPGFGFSTLMLAYWVRERKLMTLEDAIKKMTFLPASVFGIHDRGLLRRGMAADMFVFDPDTIDQTKPGSGQRPPRRRAALHQGAKGIHYTIVNGTVLMKNGTHTGAYPGKVLRSS
jgi:N-acyl-D-aspartate/D-glutamate deacylase